MTRSLPLVRLSLLRPFATEIRKRGGDPEQLFQSVGLNEKMIFDPEASVHVMVATQFVENAAESVNDRFLAARVAAGMDLDGWPILQKAEARASTIGDYLSVFVSTANEIASSAVEYLHIEGPTAILGERRAFKPTVLPSQNDAFMAALAWAILRRALHDHLDPSKVTVVVCDPSALPPEFDLMHPLKGDTMGFQLRFPSAWLSARFETALDEETETAVADTGLPEFVHSFRQILRAHVAQESLTAARCAELTAMSRHKLKRRLAAYGTDISSEIEVVRREYARDSLANSDRSIADIATTLGYSDPANFARAFRRWTGETPSRWREMKQHVTKMS